MSSVEVKNAPSYLSMIDFKGISDKYGGLQRSCRFITRIRPVGQYLTSYIPMMKDLVYLTEVSEMPGKSFMNLDVRYYGPNHKLPFQTQYEDINLTFLCRNNSLEREFFDDWMLVVNPINTFDFNYRDDYRAEIDVFQYAEAPSAYSGDAPRPVYHIVLHNAYPIILNSQPMTWADDQFQRLIVSFTYTHWSRPGIDPIPRGGEPPNFSYSLVEGRTVER